MKKNWFVRVVLGLIIALILSISGLVRLYTDFLWFDALGFSKIFLISLISKINLFFAAAIIFFLFAIINLWISSRFTEKDKFPFKLKLLITAALSIMVAGSVSSGWFKVLQYLRQTPFNLEDPIFMKDVSFYIFTLPFYDFVLAFLMSIIIITIILVLLDSLKSYFGQFL